MNSNDDMNVVATINTSVVVATASACANSPLACPNEPIVWNRAITAVVPITTSPSAVIKTVRAIRPTGSRMMVRRTDERQDQDNEMPESHRNQSPLDDTHRTIDNPVLTATTFPLFHES